MRILLSAYACAPNRGSEPGVGWGWATALTAAGHEVHVLTRTASRAEIERAGALPNPVAPNAAGPHFHYFDPPPLLNRAFAGVGGIGRRLRYIWWQIAVRPLVRELLERHAFDVVHHVTFAQFWSPCALTEAGRRGTPFIWGPVGGGEIEPAAFWPALGPRAAAWEAARFLLSRISHRLPWARAAAAACRVAVATTPETAERLTRLGARRVIVRSQVALEPDRRALLTALADLAARSAAATPPRFVFIGNLIAYKGAWLALDAVARLDGDWRLDVVGDGPDLRSLKRRAVRLGVADRVIFHGRLRQEAAWRLLAGARAMLLPALHDSGGFAAAEAMTVGAPPVCLKLGGPAVVVGDDGGVLVPAADPAAATEGLARALRRLLDDPAWVEALSRQAREIAETRFSWPAAVAVVYAAAGFGEVEDDEA